MSDLVARPLSRRKIRKASNLIRKFYSAKYGDEIKIDVIKLLEVILPSLDDEFEYDYVTRDVLGNKHGLTKPDEMKILIREDVYLGALENKGRDRMTIGHEIGHLILHNEESVSFAREFEEPKTYEDPEWQAKAFAGELLIPFEFAVENPSISKIAEVCGVSRKAAETHLNALKSKGDIKEVLL